MKILLALLLVLHFASFSHADSKHNDHNEHDEKHHHKKSPSKKETHHKEHGDEENHKDKHYHQDAHVHGVAELTIAMDSENIELQLQSPAINIVGFEHKASKPEQVLAVEHAKDTLGNPQQLFTFTGSVCQAAETNVDVSAVMNSSQNHDHSESHHNDKGEDSHSEITATYQFICKEGSTVSSINITLLTEFPAIEELNVMWIVNGKQGASKLSDDSSRIIFK